MKVLFFAQSRQAAGCEEAFLEVKTPISSAEFWDRLVGKFSTLAPLRHSTRLARNDSYVSADELLRPDDEVVLIPPVSGG